MISQTIARYSAGFCKIDMTEGNRGWCRKGRRLRIEALLEMQLHNNRPPHLSHHWPSQSVKRPKKRRDCRWISHRLLCRSCRIFGRSFWCSWNSPRSMLPPSPEGCAIACKLKRGSKNGSQQIVTKKIVPIFFYLGQGSGGRRKCRWRLWWVRLQWKGRAGIWKQSVREPSPTSHLHLVPNKSFANYVCRLCEYFLDFFNLFTGIWSCC